MHVLPRGSSFMAQPPHSSLAAKQAKARSDDAEADSFEQPLVAPAVHPFTGTFAAGGVTRNN